MTGCRSGCRIAGLYLVAFVSLVTWIAVTRTPTVPGPAHAYSSSVLQADWGMTQQMATDVGPGMQAGMATYGMLQRSQDPAYLAALEDYAHQIDRMLGRSP